MVIRVSDLKDEILFPTSRGCSSFGKLLAQLEMSYLFTPEFIDVVKEFQKHSGFSETVHTRTISVILLFHLFVLLTL